MKAFLIDPLKVGTSVVVQAELEEDAAYHSAMAFLTLPPTGDVERIDLPGGAELVVAGPSHRDHVRRLGEFRIMKSTGDYRSLAGRGVVLGHDGEASDVLGMLASSGTWVSA